MSAAIHSVLNHTRDLLSPPESRKTREKEIRDLEMVRVAAAVGIFVCAFLFALIPNLFTFFLLGPIAYGCYEAITVARNIQNILENCANEAIARLSEKNLWMQVTENTFIARAILRLSLPSMNRY